MGDFSRFPRIMLLGTCYDSETAGVYRVIVHMRVQPHHVHDVVDGVVPLDSQAQAGVVLAVGCVVSIRHEIAHLDLHSLPTGKTSSSRLRWSFSVNCPSPPLYIITRAHMSSWMSITVP